MTDDENLDLIIKLKEGDEKAFEQVFKQYYGMVYSVTYRMICDRQAAEDLTQEIFIKVYKGIKNFRFDSSFKTWLYRIIVNMCINYKQKKVKMKTCPLCEFPGKSHIKKNTKNNPENRVIDQELQITICKAIMELPVHYKITIILRDFEGLSYKEIAKALDCPIGTVMSRLYKAKKILKGKLRPYIERMEKS